MDVVGVEGEVAAGTAGGVRAVTAGPVGEWEREPHSSDSLRTFGPSSRRCASTRG